MSEKLSIQSHRGIYTATFMEEALAQLNAEPPNNAHFIIDAKVAKLYGQQLERILNKSSCLLITAAEAAKTLDRFTDYIEHLVAAKIRRTHKLVAIGGGITQDIVSFLSATLLRGIPWIFYPTTLLAQADSCIGSKSSINVGRTKNILGTYSPPEKIYIDPNLLNTLEDRELRSGFGEMLKVHAIDGPASFDRIASEYDRLAEDPDVVRRFIQSSLEIKKNLIEVDEFDRGPRNIMNYGHSFGHAIESATDYAIPHGIAVSLGMDMANFVAWQLDVSNEDQYKRMHPVLAANYDGWNRIQIPHKQFFIALSKDKKNTDRALKLILPDKKGVLSVGLYQNDDTFKEICKVFFKGQSNE